MTRPGIAFLNGVANRVSDGTRFLSQPEIDKWLSSITDDEEPMTYAEHDLQAFRDRVYVTTGARLTLTDAAVELDRIRGVYRAPLARMADPYFDPTLSEEYALSA